MWCDLGKPVTCCTGRNCKIKEIVNIIPMFFFIFESLWTSITFDTSITKDPSKRFWKKCNLNFHMIPVTPNINFPPCDRFSQITSLICTHIRVVTHLYCIYMHEQKYPLKIFSFLCKKRPQTRILHCFSWRFFLSP